MALKIPDSDRLSLAKLGAMSAADFDQFISAIRSTPPAMGPEHLTRGVATACPSVPVATIRGLIKTFLSLFNTKAGSKTEPARFVADIAVAVFDGAPLPGISAAARTGFETRIGQILELERPLGMTLRAGRSAYQDPRILKEVVLNTDVRPVFAGMPATSRADTLESVVVVHRLRVDFHPDPITEAHESVTFTLDTADLSDLVSALNSALTRAKQVKEWAGMTGIAIVDNDRAQ